MTSLLLLSLLWPSVFWPSGVFWPFYNQRRKLVDAFRSARRRKAKTKWLIDTDGNYYLKVDGEPMYAEDDTKYVTPDQRTKCKQIITSYVFLSRISFSLPNVHIYTKHLYTLLIIHRSFVLTDSLLWFNLYFRFFFLYFHLIYFLILCPVGVIPRETKEANVINVIKQSAVTRNLASVSFAWSRFIIIVYLRPGREIETLIVTGSAKHAFIEMSPILNPNLIQSERTSA